MSRDNCDSLDISCGHTTRFYLGKIDLSRENLPEFTRGKFISGFLFSGEKGHTEENRVWVFTVLLQD